MCFHTHILSLEYQTHPLYESKKSAVAKLLMNTFLHMKLQMFVGMTAQCRLRIATKNIALSYSWDKLGTYKMLCDDLRKNSWLLIALSTPLSRLSCWHTICSHSAKWDSG